MLICHWVIGPPARSRPHLVSRSLRLHTHRNLRNRGGYLRVFGTIVMVEVDGEMSLCLKLTFTFFLFEVLKVLKYSRVRSHSLLLGKSPSRWERVRNLSFTVMTR